MLSWLFMVQTTMRPGMKTRVFGHAAARVFGSHLKTHRNGDATSERGIAARRLREVVHESTNPHRALMLTGPRCRIAGKNPKAGIELSEDNLAPPGGVSARRF